MAEDRRILAPYGNVYFADTPHSDRLAFMLYNDERQRKLRHEREGEEMDKLLNKEFSNIRSADTEDIIGQYNQYKAIKKQLLFDPKAQRDTKLYNQLQQQAGESLANLYSSINKSRELKTQYEGLINERKTNPDKFSTDFFDKVNAFSQTPMSKLRVHPLGDLSNLDTYRWQGSTTNFEPLITKAAGVKRPLGEPVVTKDGLKFKTETYEGFNSPYEFYDNLIGQLAGSEKPYDFVLTFGNITPEQEKQITEQYAELLNDDNYRKLYGIAEGQDFPESAYETQAGRIARLLAMKHALNRRPSSKIAFTTDTEGQMKQQLANQKELEGIRQRNRERMAALNQSYRLAAYDYKNAKTVEEENGILDGMVNDQFDDGASDKREFTLYGKKYEGRSVKIPRSLRVKYAIKKDDKSLEYADEFFMTEDKKYLVPIFYKRDDKNNIIQVGNKAPIVAKKGQPILMSSYKADLGKEFLTRKDLAGELDDEFSDEEQNAPAPVVPKPTTQKKSEDKPKTFNPDLLRKAYGY